MLVGGSSVCYKLQLEDRTTLGLNGVAPDRSWDTRLSYAYPRLLVGGSCVCNKLQLEDRTTLGYYGVTPDRSWDTRPSYA